MSNLAPIVNVKGLVREAVPATTLKDGQRQPFGTRLTIMTEPDGGFLDVTAFMDDFPLDEAAALKGCAVDALVTLGARAGTRGGAFLAANLSAVQITGEPVAA